MFDFLAKGVEACLESFGTAGSGPGAVEDEGGKAMLTKLCDFFKLLFEEDGIVEGDGLAVAGSFIQQVALRPEACA